MIIRTVWDWCRNKQADDGGRAGAWKGRMVPDRGTKGNLFAGERWTGGYTVVKRGAFNGPRYTGSSSPT